MEGLERVRSEGESSVGVLVSDRGGFGGRGSGEVGGGQWGRRHTWYGGRGVPKVSSLVCRQVA